MRRAALGVLVALGVLAPAAAHDPAGTKVTWSGDIARLVQARCVRCHTTGGKGPMPLERYADARPWARAIREEVLARRMPKWHAARGYGRFANDPSLSPFEIALVVAWVDGGAIRGDAAPVSEAAAAMSPASPVAVPAPDTALPDPITVKCASRPLPPGRLAAIAPHLAEGSSAGFVVVQPNGRRDIVAWIRDFEADFAETYRLRTPLPLPPGSRLEVEATGRCTVALHITPQAAKPKGKR